MSYVVLARRFRPQSFDEVVGQEHVSATLQNAVRDGRLAHAYLFCGPRGVGKTSMARILAKALNCHKSKKPTDTPCGKCDSCTEIAEGRSMDVTEMDAASHTGVDDVRLLREGALYATARDRFKVYIIDEAHMMSRSAFNALLKMLEEPPAHVKFVFATTEPERLPDTIVSRCQRFDFRRIIARDSRKRLEQIVSAEKLKVDDDALALIARRARGGLRDAQGLLDQLVSYKGGKKITVEDVLAMVGAVPDQKLEELLRAIAEARPGDALTILSECLDAGAELDEVASALADRLRGVLLVAVGGRDSALVSGEYGHIVDNLEQESRRTGVGDLLRMSSVIAEARRTMRGSPEPRIVLELALVRLAEMPGLVDLRSLVDQLSRSGSASAESAGAPSVKPSGTAAGSSGLPPLPPAGRNRPATPRTTDRRRKSIAGSSEVSPFSDPEITSPPPATRRVSLDEDLPTIWKAFREAVKDLHASTNLLLNFCHPVELRNGALRLVMKEGSFFQQEQLENPEKQKLLTEAAEKAFGQSLKVLITAAEADRAGSKTSSKKPGPGGGPQSKEDPLRKAASQPAVRKLLNKFDGRVIKVRKNN